VHLRGTVTLFWPGESLCLRDASGTICTRTKEKKPLAVDEIADVVGFAEIEGEAHILTDVTYRPTGNRQPAAATPMTASDVVHGLHDSELIAIDGQLIGRDQTTSDTTLMLSAGNLLFTAVLPKSLSHGDHLVNGSRLRITGICSVSVSAENSAAGGGIAENEGGTVTKSFRILMRSPDDIVVLQKASWWTPAHLLMVLALALSVTLIALVWVAALHKRVAEQTKVIRESEERFRHMALHDALTGAASRSLLQDRLHIGVETARRHKDCLTLMMLDIDHFKQINDTYGHQAGDEVLRVIAKRLQHAVRKSDTVARMGGDEFVVLLPDLGEAQAARKIAADMVAALAQPVPFERRAISVSVSVGVCTGYAAQLEAEALLRNADAALYQAKARGRNCFQVYDPEMVAIPSD
jgi:diguanylate cyclase (GGDEF)-like protein